jgi:hypothetical protein
VHPGFELNLFAGVGQRTPVTAILLRLCSMTGALISQEGKPGRFLLANYDLLAQHIIESAESLRISPWTSNAAKHFVLTFKVMERLTAWNDCHEQVFRLMRFRNEFQAKPQELD